MILRSLWESIVHQIDAGAPRRLLWEEHQAAQLQGVWKRIHHQTSFGGPLEG